MSRKRTLFSTEFKTQVVLELLKGELTVTQLAIKYDITSKNILNWKQLFLENAALAFDSSNATKSSKAELEKLKKENEKLASKLFDLTLERDYAVEKLKDLAL